MFVKENPDRKKKSFTFLTQCLTLFFDLLCNHGGKLLLVQYNFDDVYLIEFSYEKYQNLL